jgi:hypothetical protein
MSDLDNFFTWATRTKSFNAQQPRDAEGKWTGGAGGVKGTFEGERTGKYAGQYSGGDGMLTADMKAVYSGVLDGQSDIVLSMPVQRQSSFGVKSLSTKKTAGISSGSVRGEKAIIVNLSKPKTEGLGNLSYKSQVFKMEKWGDLNAAGKAADFIKSELSTP